MLLVAYKVAELGALFGALLCAVRLAYWLYEAVKDPKDEVFEAVYTVGMFGWASWKLLMATKNILCAPAQLKQC